MERLPPLPADWRLAWSDEFDCDGAPDPTRWVPEYGRVRNQEAQFYTRDRRENARVEGGCLVIEARREAWEGAEYTSASLTARRDPLRYGRIEVRAKLPRGRGLWPAIWTLGLKTPEVPWPDCGELDLMEHVGFEPDRIHANIHTKAFNHVLRTNLSAHWDEPGHADRFHDWVLDWTGERILIGCDGIVRLTHANDGRGDPATWPFAQPQYLILNLAVGGFWGGQQGIDDTAFPQRFLIDHVRIYAPPAQAQTPRLSD